MIISFYVQKIIILIQNYLFHNLLYHYIIATELIALYNDLMLIRLKNKE